METTNMGMGMDGHVAPPSRGAGRFRWTWLALALVVSGVAGTAQAQPCVPSDNGNGTVDLPPTAGGCGYLSPQDVHMIINGLPPGTTVRLGAEHFEFANIVRVPGGPLGGERENFVSNLRLQLQGTGDLAGWNRLLFMSNVNVQTDTAPRGNGPVQSFATDMAGIQGQLPPGDPDFDLLRITAGSNFGMPSPGHTTLTQLPGGNWNVDSFFDVTYRIDFVGAPGGPLGGMSGSTTGTIRMQTGQPAPDPHRTLPTTAVNFGTPDVPPIPADFFHPGSQPFFGTVQMQGGPVDTLVQRSSRMVCPLPPPAPCDPIQTELVALSLQSVSPITVTGGGPATSWNVAVDLSSVPQSPGSLQATKTHPNGGTFDAVIRVLPKLVFSQVGNPSNTRTLDYGMSGMPDIQVQLSGVPWVRNLGPDLQGSIAAPNNGDFVPGVREQVPGDPTSQTTEAANGQSSGGGVKHVIDPVPLCPLIGGATDPCVAFQARDCKAVGPGQVCVPVAIQLTPTGPQVVACGCRGTAECHVDFGPVPGNPICVGGCPQPGLTCDQFVSPTGVYTCDCVQQQPCEPDSTRQTCIGGCPNLAQACQAKCARFNPATGTYALTNCDCVGNGDCHLDIGAAGGNPFAARGGGGNPCEVPDNGGGTVTLPPAGCEYLSPDEVHMIIDGLPAGTTIELGTIHKDFICHQQGTINPVCSFSTLVDCDQPGGSLGGEQECNFSNLDLTIKGTGTLAGFNRTAILPIGFETHTAPRTPGDPVQSFDTTMFRLFGQITGDPDFDLLRITAGTDFGLPSPGHTTLTQLPGGNWAVDSFFDIEYRIDFIGAPGGPLAGKSGSTTGTIRMTTGGGGVCVGVCPPGMTCNETRTVNADGTYDICCNCETPVCEPNPTQTGCNNSTCPTPTDKCEPKCAVIDPATGAVSVTDCECTDPANCHLYGNFTGGAFVAARGTGGNGCTVPDNGGGTITLPPEGCEYLSPDDVHEILNGLPGGTTIQVGAIHKGFLCTTCQGGPLNGQDCDTPLDCAGFPCLAQNSVCSFGIQDRCETSGGSLGGAQECADSTLELTMQGTGSMGGYSRNLLLPVEFETHVSPRTPGQPVQSFDTEMFRLFGQIVNPGSGDPDFDLLRIVAGNDFGLPSPGHTTLTQLPGGNWAVDSFFDVTYRIDFVGRAGGPFSGMSGSTTATIRMSTGAPTSCQGTCPPGTTCEESRTVDPLTGKITVCCNCIPAAPCEPNATQTGCQPHICPIAGQECIPTKVKCDATGCHVIECQCNDPNTCHIQLPVPPQTAPTCTGPCPPGMKCARQAIPSVPGGPKDTFYCKCIRSIPPPTGDPTGANKNRYLTFSAAGALAARGGGTQEAIRVKLTSIPLFPGFNGETRWADQPFVVSGGLNVSLLACDPYFQEWGSLSSVHITGADVVPGPATYTLQSVGDDCDDLESEDCYSTPLTVVTTKFGDVVGSTPGSGPDGIVNFLDIAAIVSKFKGEVTAPILSRTDIHPNVPNRIINFLDISSDVDAFKGKPYPFSGPCVCPSGSTCPAEDACGRCTP